MKNILFSSAILAVIVTAIATGSLYSSASSSKDVPQPVSPALSVLAEDSGMAMAGLVGSPISFDADDFARAVNLSDIDSVTVTKAPAISEGELRVGNTVVNSGQTISAASLSLMTYVPSSQSTRSSFRFSVNESGYDMPCQLYLLNEVNSAPTLSQVSENYLQVSTHRNVTLYGTLPCHDPEGDTTFIEIVSYPTSGSLILTDKFTGEYTYAPNTGYAGKDSFTYVARDLYGNYSASQTVSLKVTRPSVSVSLDDMRGSPAYNAALTMLEEGIMSGTQVGSDTYFHPDKTVSRGEFIVMTMQAVGIKDVTSVSQTPFADDESIPDSMKGYVSAAYRLGYINGIETEQGLCFEANRSITRAEVAVILGNILNVSTPTVLPTFKDSADIPAWATASLYSLNSIGVMNTVSGNVSPLNDLTRADAAVILSNVISYLD